MIPGAGRPVHYVPGLGAVAWTTGQVARYAANLADAHSPSRPPVRVVWRRATRTGGLSWLAFPWPARRSVPCVCCHRPWPCPASVWASGHHSTTALIVDDD